MLDSSKLKRIKNPLKFVVLAVLFLSATAPADAQHNCGGCLLCQTAAAPSSNDGSAVIGQFQYFGTPNDRWSFTATDGFTGVRGDAVTLTWGFAPDGTVIGGGVGEPLAPNSLISALDAQFGNTGGADLTQREWFGAFDNAYSRWGEISGLTMSYEAADDGATMGQGGSSGSLGVRADMRIGGRPIDGSTGSNTLAYNYSPNSGDHVVDTDNVTGSTFGNSGSGTNLTLENTVAHEAGHGIGLAHVESNNGAFLMEPFISTSFEGPQLDEILGVQRQYGDALEQGGGNDTFDIAYSLGLLPSGGNVTIGDLGDSTAVSLSQTDFISIDGLSDTDYFQFSIASAGLLDLTLTPRGTTYNQGPQGGPSPQPAFDTSSLNNLGFTIYDTDGITVLATRDANGSGSSESISNLILNSAGNYYASAWGNDDQVQLYGLDFSFTAASIPEPTSILLLGIGSLTLMRRKR